jgi:hypothetical protein
VDNIYRVTGLAKILVLKTKIENRPVSDRTIFTETKVNEKTFFTTPIITPFRRNVKPLNENILVRHLKITHEFTDCDIPPHKNAQNREFFILN